MPEAFPDGGPGTEMLNLSADFAAVPTAAWEAAIQKDLKGADYEKRLVWRTEEGIAVHPYYRSGGLAGLEGQVQSRPAQFPFVRGRGAPWEIAEKLEARPGAIRADVLHEEGAHAVQELGYALAAGVERLAELAANRPVDEAARQVEFIFAMGSTYFLEIAKLRAARLLWAQAVSAFGPEDRNSCCMRLEARTSRRNKSVYDCYTNLLRVTTEALSAAAGGCDRLMVEPFGFDPHLAVNLQHILQEESHLDAVAVFNNIPRTCIEALAAVLGHTQSLHTNALDEAIALPTDFSARIARNTQIYLQEETGVTKVVDPWAGSYYVESLTHDLMRKAWHHIQEVESLGGMTKAIETGLPKMRIEEAAARRQAQIDSGRETIVGVNKYPPTHEEQLVIREVDNRTVRESQVRRLNEIRRTRDGRAVDEALTALTACAQTGDGNLLNLSVNAARVRATLGEISSALEKVFGRYQAVSRTISGVYSSESEDDPEFCKARELADEFAQAEGRRPRILVAKLGQDGHDRGAKVIASAFADLGFDVDVGPLFQTPREAARMAVENDVHVLGISSLAGGHKTLVPEVISELKRLGRNDILVYTGGVIPPRDYECLLQAGVSGVFGPGTVIPICAQKILHALMGSVGAV